MTSFLLLLLAPVALAPMLRPAVPKAGPLTIERGPYRVGSARPVPIPTCWDARWLPVKGGVPGNGASVPCQAKNPGAGR